MRVQEIRENSLKVIDSRNNATVIAYYVDSKGSYFYNEDLKKEYFLDKNGVFISDASYLESKVDLSAENIAVAWWRTQTRAAKRELWFFVFGNAALYLKDCPSNIAIIYKNYHGID